MKFGLVRSPRFRDHDTGHHVENAGRLEAIEARLGHADGTVPVELRPATDVELCSLHNAELVARVEAASAAGGEWLDPDTYVSPASAAVARLAAGSCMELAARVGAGELDRGMALVRPPGHHATPTKSMGFCLYSNIALAARYCRDHLGLKRVLIFDWDVHHGNGTEACLWECPDSCFFSIHQWPFYPGTGRLEDRGAGLGSGLTYNLPLAAGMHDEDYLWAFQQLVDPVARAYDPQLILVSAGYDAHREDPLGGMKLTAAGFGALAAGVARLASETSAQGKLVGVLEGGYNPVRLAESVEATIQAWLNPSLPPDPVHPDRVATPCLRTVARAREVFGLA